MSERGYYFFYKELYHHLGQRHLLLRQSDNINQRVAELREERQRIRQESEAAAIEKANSLHQKNAEMFEASIAHLKTLPQTDVLQIAIQRQQQNYQAHLNRSPDPAPFLAKTPVLDAEEQERTRELENVGTLLANLDIALQELEDQHNIVIQEQDALLQAANQAVTDLIEQKRQQGAAEFAAVLQNLKQQIDASLEEAEQGNLKEQIERYQTIYKNSYKRCLRLAQGRAHYAMCEVSANRETQIRIRQDLEDFRESRQQAQQDSRSKESRADRDGLIEAIKANEQWVKDQFESLPTNTSIVKLVYADAPTEPVRNTRVVAWQYLPLSRYPRALMTDNTQCFHAHTDAFGYVRPYELKVHKNDPTETSNLFYLADTQDKQLMVQAIAYSGEQFGVMQQRHLDKYGDKLADYQTMRPSDFMQGGCLTFDHGLEYGLMLMPSDPKRESPGSYRSENLLDLASERHPHQPEQATVAGIHQVSIAGAKTSQPELKQGDIPAQQHTQQRDQVDVVIPVYCTLPAWTIRLQNVIDELKRYQINYSDTLQDRLRDLQSVKTMQQSAEWNLQYPSDEQTTEDIAEKLKLVTSLNTLEEHIQQVIAEPDEMQSDAHTWHQTRINWAARELHELINSEALKQEFNRYYRHHMQQVAEKAEEGDDDIDVLLECPGPDLLAGDVLGPFFETFSEALGLLGATRFREQIEKEWIEPLVEFLGGGVDSEHVLPARDELGQWREKLTGSGVVDMADQILMLEHGSPPESQDNLLINIFTIWKNEYKPNADVLFHRLPGPPSALMVCLDVYGDFISKHLYQQFGNQPGLLLRFQLNCLSYLSGKQLTRILELNIEHLLMYSLSKAIVTRGRFNLININEVLVTSITASHKYVGTIFDSAPDADLIYNRFKDGFGQRYAKTLAQSYSTIVNLTGLISGLYGLQELSKYEKAIQENPNNTQAFFAGLNSILGAAGASLNTYNFMVQRLNWAKSAHKGLMQSMGYSLSAAGLSSFCDRFAHVLNYFVAIDSALKAEDAFNQARYETAARETLNSASLVALTLGSQLMARSAMVGATFLAPGLGQVLLIGGAIIQVGLLAWDFAIYHLKPTLQQHYSDAFDQLKQSPHMDEYHTKDYWQKLMYADLMTPIAIIQQQSEYGFGFGPWGKLSWHALVPAKAKLEAEGMNKSDIQDALEDMIDLPDDERIALFRELEKWQEKIKDEPMKRLASGTLVQDAIAALQAGHFMPHPADYPESESGPFSHSRYRQTYSPFGPKSITS